MFIQDSSNSIYSFTIQMHTHVNMYTFPYTSYTLSSDTRMYIDKFSVPTDFQFRISVVFSIVGSVTLNSSRSQHPPPQQQSQQGLPHPNQQQVGHQETAHVRSQSHHHHAHHHSQQQQSQQVPSTASPSDNMQTVQRLLTQGSVLDINKLPEPL